jgi:xanthine dehydrogenase iron-sulfur cluster and FAD-binding subunit A
MKPAPFAYHQPARLDEALALLNRFGGDDFCTPGIVMTFEAWLRDNPAPSEAAPRQALSANLCRCTGDHNIVRAIMKAAAAMSATGQPA